MTTVKILWIDDSEAWAKSVQGNLAIIGTKFSVSFRFVNAINGEDILFQCRSYDFDMIVMDYDMQPHSGEKYIRDVRAEDHLEHIPIFFYSQNNSIDLESLIQGLENVFCYYRPNLEDAIKDNYCRK